MVIYMANNTLLNEFNAKKREIKAIQEVNDYAVFPDKEKLEILRSKIVENLINNQITFNNLV